MACWQCHDGELTHHPPQGSGQWHQLPLLAEHGLLGALTDHNTLAPPTPPTPYWPNQKWWLLLKTPPPNHNRHTAMPPLLAEPALRWRRAPTILRAMTSVPEPGLQGAISDHSTPSRHIAIPPLPPSVPPPPWAKPPASTAHNRSKQGN